MKPEDFTKNRKKYGIEVAIAAFIHGIRRRIFVRSGPNDNLNKFTNPWSIRTFKERYYELVNSSKKFKLVYVFPSADYAVFRYRVYNQVQVLNKSKDYHAEYFFENELPNIKALKPNLCFMVRMKWTTNTSDYIKHLEKESIKIIFDVDDLVFDIKYAEEINFQLGVPEDEIQYWFAETARINRVAIHADAYTTTNEFLAKQISKTFDKSVYILKNHMNEKQVKLSKSLVKNKQEPEFAFGYFSGSTTHNNDFALIENSICSLLDKNPGSRFLLVGPVLTSSKLDSYGERVVKKGLFNYLDLQKIINKVKINLIPSVINDFTNSKSEIKYFEAGILKVPSIASPTYVYKEIIKDGANGFLAKPDQWENKIQKLLDDKKLYSDVSEAAYNTSESNYTDKAVFDEKNALLKKLLP